MEKMNKPKTKDGIDAVFCKDCENWGYIYENIDPFKVGENWSVPHECGCAYTESKIDKITGFKKIIYPLYYKESNMNNDCNYFKKKKQKKSLFKRIIEKIIWMIYEML